MSFPRSLIAAALLIAVLGAVPAQAADPAPAWSVYVNSSPTNFVPGDTGRTFYDVAVFNSGGAPTNGNPVTITDTLPAGLTVTEVDLMLPETDLTGEMDAAADLCETDNAATPATVTCTVPEDYNGRKAAVLVPDQILRMSVHVSVPADASGTLTNVARVEGGGAPAASGSSENEATAVQPPTGFAGFDMALGDVDGSPQRQAGSYPYSFTTRFNLNTVRAANGFVLIPAGGDIKDIAVNLPPGLIGNPTAVSRCSAVDFNTITQGGGSANRFDNQCPDGSVVGIANIWLEGFCCTAVPVYNLVPPKDMPAQLGFQVVGLPIYIHTAVRTGSDYGVNSFLKNISQVQRAVGTKLTIWGVPADPSHDTLRGRCVSAYGYSTGSCPAGVARKPFLRLPTSCAGPLRIDMQFNSWSDPGTFLQRTFDGGSPRGCERLDFTPTISLKPQTRVAASPTGLDVHLHVPQGEQSTGLAEADLRKAVVTLPEGVAVNPGSANGLAGCSSAEIDINGSGPARCPDAAKIGSIEINTPLLPEPLNGSVYAAAQNDNPFNTLLAIYLVAEGQGVVVKLAGKVIADPRTGQLVTTFDDNPQLPFSDFRLHFNGGPRGVLTTPSQCGTYSTHSELTPWSTGIPLASDSPFTIDQGCATGGFAPALSAGVTNPAAGSSSSFVMRLTRADGEQNIHALDTTLPPGLLAKIAGVPQCPDHLAATGDCPAASRVGETSVGTGVGSSPLFVPQPGKAPTAVYLGGPYKGAPFSLVVKVPAQAGPYDLGTVAVRAALHVDPTDAHVTGRSDPVPQIMDGIPLAYRDIRIAVDRPGFMRSPTSCDPTQIAAAVTSAGTSPLIEVTAGIGFSTSAGMVADLRSRFQVGDCARLPFRPKLRLRLTGASQTKDGGHPGIVARASQRPGEAGIRQVKVALPLSLALDPDNAQGLCEYEDGLRLACPASSIIGRAEAITPLLNEPLTGPVYFVKNVRIHPRTGRRIRTLPALLVTLTGENGVKINLRASSDVDKRGRLVSSFSDLPDAPVSSFRLRLAGGRDGIVVVTHKKDVCRGKQVALAQTDGHNGKRHNPKIRLATPCVKVGKPRPRGRTLRLPVRVPQAGTLRAGGGKSGLATTSRRLAKPGKTTLTLKPTRAGLRRLARHDRLRLRVPVSFTPRGTKRAQRTTSPAITMRR